MKERLKNNKGFTLVEIIVVLVILAILAAIAVPAVLGYVDESKKTRYIEEAHSIYAVIQTEEARYKALGNELNDDTYKNTEYKKELTETITKKLLFKKWRLVLVVILEKIMQSTMLILQVMMERMFIL